MDDLDVHEKSIIMEGLMRVKRNGLEYAAMTDFKQETRDSYRKDAETAQALLTRLRLRWWGLTEEAMEAYAKEQEAAP